MKLNKLSAACGLAFAALSIQAFAHGPSVTPDLEVFISGSSALQGTLGKIAEGMMTAGTIDVYYDTASNGSNYRAYFGTVSGTGTALDGKKVLMHNRANGGSFQGVGPVARAQAITRMKIEAATCTSTGAAYPSATFKCTNTVNAVPDAGVSDVEPAMFVYPNLPAGETALNATELGHLSPASQNAVVFGIAVSDNVPVTNLSRSQITSLLTGNYADWSQVDPSLSGPVLVERRTPGSGTQASANAYFGGLPCSTGGVPLASASVAATPTTAISGFTVVENATTGGVKSGLNASFTAGNKAIGLVSTENTAVAGTDHWHFVSIDGITPNVANAVNGKYDYFVEQSIQWRNATVNGVAAPSGNLATFLDQFKMRSGDPAILTTLPGVAALPTNYDPTLYPAGQVMKGTKLNNTCQPTQLFY